MFRPCPVGLATSLLWQGRRWRRYRPVAAVMRARSAAELRRALLVARQYHRACIQTFRLKGSLRGLRDILFPPLPALLRRRKCSLTRQAQNGDRAAWGQFVARFYNSQWPLSFGLAEPIREPSSGVLGRILGLLRSD